MKRTLFFLAVILTAWACEGPQGEVGPTGAKGQTGDKGATGAQGPAGTNGTNATIPKIYDFTVDLSKALPSYSMKTAFGPLDVPLVYIKTSTGNAYSPLPFKGYAYTSDNKDFVKLDLNFSYWPNTVYFDNTTGVPSGATFLLRMVVLTGEKGARVETDISYEDLKNRYKIPD